MTKETELPAVKVKALSWELREDGATYHAQSIVGRWAYWEGHYLPPEGHGGIKADDPAGAAQADYERRIRSALVPSTLKDDTVNGGDGEAERFEPVGYVTKNELTKLRLGVSCVDLFGKVAPKGFEMVPLYDHPAESRCEELVKALKDRDEEIARYQGLLDAAIDDYNSARNTALEEAAKVAYDYECSLADYGDSVDAKHFYEGGVGDASIGISKAIRSLIPERKASDDLKEAEGVGE